MFVLSGTFPALYNYSIVVTPLSTLYFSVGAGQALLAMVSTSSLVCQTIFGNSIERFWQSAAMAEGSRLVDQRPRTTRVGHPTERPQKSTRRPSGSILPRLIEVRIVQGRNRKAELSKPVKRLLRQSTHLGPQRI